MTTTAKLIAALVNSAASADTFTRQEILNRVDKLIDFYIKERMIE